MSESRPSYRAGSTFRGEQVAATNQDAGSHASLLAFMGAGDPYTTITEPTFVARFLLDPDVETADTVANVDTFVDLPDGSTWALTICTVDEVGQLLTRWKETGEVANGSYCWAADQLIVPEAGLSAMTAAIRELVRSGDITAAAIRCEDQGQDASDATETKPTPLH
jgi:hypothetical protein